MAKLEKMTKTNQTVDIVAFCADFVIRSFFIFTF